MTSNRSRTKNWQNKKESNERKKTDYSKTANNNGQTGDKMNNLRIPR
jgi:hypothetical protein